MTFTKFKVSATPVDMSGSYKLQANSNYQKFLEVQGVGWALRKAADSAAASQVIAHDVAGGRVRLQVKSLVSMAIEYDVGAPAKRTQIKDKVFMDRVTYSERGELVVTKRNDKDGYTIVATRRLSPDKKTLYCEQVCSCDNGKSATAEQTFLRE